MWRRILAVGLVQIFVAWGVQAAELVVAQVAPFSGPLSGNGNANYLGAKAYFDQVNAEGGVNGSTIRFVREDDQYKPEETIRQLEAVAQKERPIAFINMLGSANVSAVLKSNVIDRLGIPVVGVTPGADSLREPGSPWIFHVHAGDNAQIRRMLAHLATVGQNKITVVYQDLPFGKNGLKFAETVAPDLKISIVGRVAVPAAADDLKGTAAGLRQTNAQAYLMILAPNSGIALVRDLRKSGDTTPLYSMSYVPVKDVIDKTGVEASSGVAIAQITPNPSSSTSGLARNFHAAMNKYAPVGTDHSQLHLIGYVSAMVLVEGLRKAGPSPTPARLAAAMRKVRFDAGGYELDFSGSNVGSQFVDIGVISRSGRLMY